MLENFQYDFTSEDADFLLEVINKDATNLNEYLLFHLEVINESLTTLKEASNSVVQVSAIKNMFEAFLISDKVVTLITKRRSSINLTSSEIDNLKINAESVVNGIKKVAEINKKHIDKIDAITLFIYLAH